MNKQELRTEIRNRKRQFTQAQLGELSLSIIMQLKKNPHLRKAQTILLYYSLPDEVNTQSDCISGYWTYRPAPVFLLHLDTKK